MCSSAFVEETLQTLLLNAVAPCQGSFMNPPGCRSFPWVSASWVRGTHRAFRALLGRAVPTRARCIILGHLLLLPTRSACIPRQPEPVLPPASCCCSGAPRQPRAGRCARLPPQKYPPALGGKA